MGALAQVDEEAMSSQFIRRLNDEEGASTDSRRQRKCRGPSPDLTFADQCQVADEGHDQDQYSDDIEVTVLATGRIGKYL